MKRNFTKILAAFALLVFMTPTMAGWGQTKDDVVAYTLTPVAGTDNGYATDEDIDITSNGTTITWNVTGNTTMVPWRIGGKNLNGVDRNLYSKDALANNVSKIEVTHGAASNVTVNSWTVIVATDADFTNVVSTLTPTFTPNTTTTISRPLGVDWSNCYYKFVYNLTIGSSNKFIAFTEAKFYKEVTSSVATPTFNPEEGVYTEAQEVEINCTTSGATIYYTTDGSTPDNHSTVYEEPIEVAETMTINAIAYVGQEASVPATATYYIVYEQATLPFTFNGGKNDIAVASGLTQDGLGDDYGTEPKLKFDHTGDWLVLCFNEAPGTLSFDIKGYSFSGGTFKVQSSNDGETYTDLKTYTEINTEAIQSEVINDLNTEVRYIRWIYTEKVSGNVGLGNIALAKYVAPQPSITVTPLEINVDAEFHQDVLTVTYTNVDPTSYTPVAIYYDAEGHQIDPTWLLVELKTDKNFRYTISANYEGARTAYFKIRCNGVYSDMVTVNQAAYVAPPTPGNWVLTSIDELTEDDVFVIVGDNGDTYAMSNDNGTSSAPAAVSVAVVDNTLSDEIGDNLQWNISRTDDGYIFYPNGTTETWLYCTNTNNGVRVGVNEGNVFIIDDGYLKNVNTDRYVGIYNSQDWRCYTSHVTTGPNPNNIEGQTFAFYKKVEEESYDLTITGYTNDNEKTGYYLIASPVTFNPYGTDMTLGDFDLYYFDQEGDSEGNEWMNWESNHFSLVPGTGYLYAKKATPEAQTYYFTLSGVPYNESGSIPLTYNSTAQFAGWNLIGNPFGEDATLDMPFYRMNGEGSGLEAVEETNSTVYAMEGVFVNAFDQDHGVLSYANFTRAGNTSGEGGMKINLTRNRGTVIDNAIVRFDNGRQLPKFQLFENSTKLYIPQGNKDYAIVRSAAEAEMPVSFRASENGTYTLAVEAENVDMNYLHLIDNMTGADVDLLATPNYTFEARTNDYTSRFRLVFSANGIDEQTAETFAYFNGTSWTVSNTGDATLQVVDITGRIVSSETITGNATVSINQPAGIYMLRLVNGNDVKVQKVVVR